ncbi:MAG: nitrite reductase small subunit NirD [Mycobacteriales bacterium]
MSEWTEICRYDELLVDRGVAAIVDGVPVAVFRMSDGGLAVIDNRDPVSGANVMSRGLVGTKGDITYVASPMYKQRFDIATGRCLDDDEVAVTVHSGRTQDGRVEVLLAGAIHQLVSWADAS